MEASRASEWLVHVQGEKSRASLRGSWIQSICLSGWGHLFYLVSILQQLLSCARNIEIPPGTGLPRLWNLGSAH